MKLRDQILEAGYHIDITIKKTGMSGFILDNSQKNRFCEYIPMAKDFKAFYNKCLNIIAQRELPGEM